MLGRRRRRRPETCQANALAQSLSLEVTSSVDWLSRRVYRSLLLSLLSSLRTFFFTILFSLLLRPSNPFRSFLLLLSHAHARAWAVWWNARVCVFVCVQRDVHTRTFTHTHINTHINIHTHKHAHTNRHTHTRAHRETCVIISFYFIPVFFVFFSPPLSSFSLSPFVSSSDLH